MKHTECKDCELRNGDCGHHFKMNGKIDYDIPSLSACDRYGDCEFFQQKERPQGDLISREALKKEFKEAYAGITFSLIECNDLIDNAPTVEQEVYIHGEDYDFFIRGYKEGRKDFEKPQAEWVTDELCRLRSCLRSGTHVGSFLQTPAQMDRFIKALDEVIKPN